MLDTRVAALNVPSFTHHFPLLTRVVYLLFAEMIHWTFVFLLSHLAFHINQDSNDIFLLDFSAEVDSNQNCIKGNSFVMSCCSDSRTENALSSSFGYFPVPDNDPFRDDPLSPPAANNSHVFATANTAHTDAGSTHMAIVNGVFPESLSHQINGLTSKNMILALSNGQWPLGGKITQGSTTSMMDGNDSRSVLPNKNPFFDSPLKNSPVTNGVTHQAQAPVTHSKDSVVISPPPQNSKAGRGRRSTKVKFHSGVTSTRTACDAWLWRFCTFSEDIENVLTSPSLCTPVVCLGVR